MKRVAILGSTGSIGRQTLEVIRRHPDLYKVHSLVADSNYSVLNDQIAEFRPRYAGLSNALYRDKIEGGVEVLPSDTALIDAIDGADVVCVACTGINGLLPTIEALKRGLTVALSNKETMVAGGHLVKSALGHGGVLLPVDSEHSAIWQSMMGNRHEDIERIILTASGGAFRDYTREMLSSATPMDALKHPNWMMGQKITIDCATLMNKGLELIEAMHLFDVPESKVDILIHKESIIHSMVEYIDGAVISEMSYPTMLIPIQLALSYPRRLDSGVVRNVFVGKTLTFDEPDTDRFPCLAIARDVASNLGTNAVVMNAVNDVAVRLYLMGKIGFYDIPDLIQRELGAHVNESDYGIQDIIDLDRYYSEKLSREYGLE